MPGLRGPKACTVTKSALNRLSGRHVFKESYILASVLKVQKISFLVQDAAILAANCTKTNQPRLNIVFSVIRVLWEEPENAGLRNNRSNSKQA